MKIIYYIFIVLLILFSMYALMHAPIYPGAEQCSGGFEHSFFGMCRSNTHFTFNMSNNWTLVGFAAIIIILITISIITMIHYWRK